MRAAASDREHANPLAQPEGRTPLLVAAENNKTEAVKLLVAKGALLQPNVRGSDVKSTLPLA